MQTRSSLHSSLWSSLQLDELDGLARSPPSSFPSKGSKLRTHLRGSTHWASKFDVVSVLGGEGEEGRGSGLGVYGHTGCINALDWSTPDGTTLASGSDDTRVCIWKLGHEPAESYADNPEIVQRYAGLGIGLSAVIHTGHRANIFSVKFAPRTTNMLFTASGDHEARVFDLNQAVSEAQSFSSVGPAGSAKREWSEYPKNSGVCTRVLKCHRGRVKRIATEGDSDAVFLTCSEDGTVRQHDLRIGHVCKRDCPPPLCSYREQGMGLYSLSTSILRPELFVVAGTSPYAYLHDRRMIPRTMMEQWGVPATPTQLTQCVRRFGPARPPLVPGPPSEESEDEDEGQDAPNTRSHVQRIQRLRQRRARMRAGEDNHVTAAKLSKFNGRELLLTYSGGPVCLYDIFDEPEYERGKTDAFTLQTSRGNGKRKAEEILRGEGSSTIDKTVGIDSISTKSPRTSGPYQTLAGSSQTDPSRKPLVLSAPVMASQAQAPSDFVHCSLEDTPGFSNESEATETSNSPVYRVTGLGNTEPSQDHDDRSTQDTLRSALRHSHTPSSQSPPHQPSLSAASQTSANFEIRMNEDGNLEMEIDSGHDGRNPPSDSGEESELNTEGYQALLRSMAAAQSEENEQTDSQEDDEESEEPEISDSEEGISSSDEPDSVDGEAYARGGINRDIPLVRPRKIYKGHRNVDTVKDVNFGGMDNLVVSGSDDGNVFIYNKESTELLAIIKGDESVVNVMQYHPQLPIMAVSGIDNSAKILAPTTLGTLEDKLYSQRKFSRLAQKEEIIQKNQDASWTSERLAMPPSVLINLLNRAVAAGGGDDDEEGAPGGRRRIPLSALLQLAGEDDTDQDCVVM